MDTAAMDTNARMFAPFRRLPTEIQDKIWTLSLPGPRCVAIQEYHGRGWAVKTTRISRDHPEYKVLRKIHKKESLSKSGEKLDGWYSPSAMPVALQVNQGSRLEALRHYKLMFGGKTVLEGCPARIYFNPGIDTLFIRSSINLNNFIKRTQNLDMVMNLAIGEAQCRGPWSKQPLTPEYFKMFPVLERLTYALGVSSRQVLQSERFRMDESFYPMESVELSPSTWAHHLVISTEQQYTFLKRWHEGRSSMTILMESGV